MPHFRRTSPEARLEMTPLLDVIFLLLTFFIFSLVMMVQARTMAVTLPTLGSGEAARPAKMVTLAIDAEGKYFVDGQETPAESLIETIKARRQAVAGDDGAAAKLLIATDVASRSESLLKAIDLLRQADMTDFSLVGRDEAKTAEMP